MYCSFRKPNLTFKLISTIMDLICVVDTLKIGIDGHVFTSPDNSVKS